MARCEWRRPGSSRLSRARISSRATGVPVAGVRRRLTPEITICRSMTKRTRMGWFRPAPPSASIISICAVAKRPDGRVFAVRQNPQHRSKLSLGGRVAGRALQNYLDGRDRPAFVIADLGEGGHRRPKQQQADGSRQQAENPNAFPACLLPSAFCLLPFFCCRLPFQNLFRNLISKL